MEPANDDIRQTPQSVDGMPNTVPCDSPIALDFEQDFTTVEMIKSH